MSIISESENEIRAVISGWLGSVASGDAGSIAGIYAEDGRILVAGSPVIGGRPAIEAFWQGLLAASAGTLVFGPTTIEVDAAGTMAFEVGTYRFETRSDGVTTRNAGGYVVVWKKTSGSWQVSVDALVANLE
ncbi:YybH family protein [Methylobacterium sp. E-045]|uniref:YybH family protein n=1 Tax=Methylobacterium sp. E-045 TaxID=2836575 RepID=UPI001FBA04DB|nr:SgcJ/EcaC family oxidoreductase [Methylobacterium sp. E-045]MCJ2130773.1 SgcJ/EcaC family oxidoreductase [Methylobacterium sp. E-045]